ncbi:MAG TPA: glycosyltransferase family 2 protein [Steroidobacteraceae bacterium]|jgi:cellulose synthase/poly-beta-1,6-N-acetylglucosamine synthase-like glycosyltransferase|nr:glycosyltransferase family 2 protein [Steroidobacteraceae bacterium]
MAAYVFWFSLSVLTYVYFGYPIMIRALAYVARRRIHRDEGYCRPVTVVITAYNEEASIASKIENIRQLDYPSELVEIIVASDGSTDSTDGIVLSCDYARVRLLRVEGRVGKTACQNAAVSQASGEVVVFTDATTRVDRAALRALIENFADPVVGCVAGLLLYEANGANMTGAGGVSYWNYEVKVRKAESDMSTLIGVSGCLYAVRRSAYRPISPKLISDFVIAMRMREQGLRTVLEPRALCFEDTLARSKLELQMRVRVAVRSISALVAERRFLNILRDPVFAWQLWSHKMLRYVSPYWMVALFVSSVALMSGSFYRIALIAQLSLMAAALAGFVLQLKANKLGVLSKPYYFLLTNVASFIAMLRYLAGHRIVTWKPIR